eukprot:scaffold27746_cov37-Prasinocladus_malaysianus.AAC.1
MSIAGGHMEDLLAGTAMRCRSFIFILPFFYDSQNDNGSYANSATTGHSSISSSPILFYSNVVDMVKRLHTNAKTISAIASKRRSTRTS